MMKYIKKFIYILFSIFIIFIIINNINIYNQTYIPKSNGIQIQINEWNEKKSKKQIFNNIENYCKKNNENISFISSHFNDDKEIKYIYPFLDKPNLNDFSYIKNQDIKIVSKNKILLQDLCGQFIINGKNNNNVNKFINFLNKQGIKSELINSNIFSSFSLFDISNQLLNTLIIIILLLLTLNCFDKINNCKKYSILKLNGSLKKQIWHLDIKKDIHFLVIINGFILIIVNVSMLYFLTKSGFIIFNEYLLIGLLLISIIYILANLISYLVIPLIDIKIAIKNGTPSRNITILGYVLKIIILLILSINIFHLQESICEYKNNNNILNIWNEQPKSYNISILGRNYTNNQEEIIGSKIKKFLSLQPYILSKNNELLFHPSNNTIGIDEGNVLIVNDNYIKQNTNLFKYINTNHSINVLIPKNKINQIHSIKQEVNSYIDFQKELPNYFKNINYKVNYRKIPIQNKVFNWNIGDNISDSISHNPIIIVINLKDFSNNFYYACLTSKEIIFNNLNSLKVNLKKSGLEPYVAGITSIKSSINKLIIKNKINFTIMIITTLISILQMVLVISFILSTFIEKNKKLIAINIIHGRSNFKILNNYILLNLILDLAVCIIAFLYFKAILILYTGIMIVTLEVISLLFMNKRFHKNVIDIINNGY